MGNLVSYKTKNHHDDEIQHDENRPRSIYGACRTCGKKEIALRYSIWCPNCGSDVYLYCKNATPKKNE